MCDVYADTLWLDLLQVFKFNEGTEDVMREIIGFCLGDGTMLHTCATMSDKVLNGFAMNECL